MQIILIRHAIAVERKPGLDDTVRPLCERGIRRFVRSVRGLDMLGVRLDHVFHSPWLRALQTAELLTPINRGMSSATALLADDPGDDVIALARRFSDKQCIAFVGHEPWMGELLSLFLLGTAHHADAMPFKKGGMAWLEGKPLPGKMFLHGMFPPKSLRRLGENGTTVPPTS